MLPKRTALPNKALPKLQERTLGSAFVFCGAGIWRRQGLAAAQGLPQFLRCVLQVVGRGLWRHDEVEIFLLDVLRRGDVLRVVHGHHMGMRMGYMNAGEGQADALDLIKTLHVACQALAHIDDMAGKIGRHILEIGVMLLGNDEHVATPYRMDIQKGEDAAVFVDGVGGKFVPRDATEQTIVRH